MGDRVYATARRDEDLTTLDSIDGITAVALDVRDAAQVRAVHDRIAADGGGLDGLVNNAGIGHLGPLAAFDDAALHEIFDVNVFGVHRVTNAVLPLLLAARGRIAIIGSQGGSISSANAGPYTMTKHALEAYTVALAEELAPHCVGVSIVQPGAIVSAIGINARDATLARLRAAPPPFDAAAADLAARIESPREPDPDAPESDDNRKPAPPAIVTEAIVHALFDAAPQPRYLVGSRWEGDRVIHALIERLLDAAASPSHGLSREALISLIDGHLRKRSGI